MKRSLPCAPDKTKNLQMLFQPGLLDLHHMGQIQNFFIETNCTENWSWKIMDLSHLWPIWQPYSRPIILDNKGSTV